MVCNYTNAAILLLGGTVAVARKLFYTLNNRLEDFCLVNASFTGQNSSGAFKPHSGVNILLGQLYQGVFVNTIVFHEYVVPDFHPVGTIGTLVGAWTRLSLANPIEDFGVGTAGACGTSCPPVVAGWQEGDSVFWHSNFFPIRSRFFVTGSIFVSGKNGNGKQLGVKSQPVLGGQKLIAEGNGFLLEIVSQGPVSQHFKAGQVTGIANFINISGANTFLVVHQTSSCGMSFSHQIGNKGMHSCCGKQNGRIIFWNQ